MPRPKPTIPRKARSVILPEKVWEAIEAEAERNERSVTGQVRIMIAEWFASHSASPPQPKRSPR